MFVSRFFWYIYLFIFEGDMKDEVVMEYFIKVLEVGIMR